MCKISGIETDDEASSSSDEPNPDEEIVDFDELRRQYRGVESASVNDEDSVGEDCGDSEDEDVDNEVVNNLDINVDTVNNVENVDIEEHDTTTSRSDQNNEKDNGLGNISGQGDEPTSVVTVSSPEKTPKRKILDLTDVKGCIQIDVDDEDEDEEEDADADDADDEYDEYEKKQRELDKKFIDYDTYDEELLGHIVQKAIGDFIKNPFHEQPKLPTEPPKKSKILDLTAPESSTVPVISAKEIETLQINTLGSMNLEVLPKLEPHQLEGLYFLYTSIHNENGCILAHHVSPKNKVQGLTFSAV